MANNYFFAIRKQITYIGTTLHSTSIIKHFFIYSFGSLCLRCIGVVLAPIMMRTLTPADYGILSLVNSFTSVGIGLIGLGLRQALSLEYFHHTGSEQKKLINDVIITYLVIAIPIIACGIYWHTIISEYIFLRAVPMSLIFVALGIIFLSFFVELLYQVMQYEHHSFHLTGIQMSLALMSGSLTLCCLWYMNLRFASTPTAQCICMLTATCIAIGMYIRNHYHHYITIRPGMIRMHLARGFPFIPSVLCGWLLACGDRWVLAHMCGMHEVGIYSIADLASQLFYFLILYPWSGAYLPYILKQFAHNKDNLKPVLTWHEHLMWLSMAIIAILATGGYFLLRIPLHWILPSAYQDALHYVWLITIGQVFLLGSYFASCLIQFYKCSYFLALAISIPACVNIGLNILLIPWFGLWGCTSATVLSYALYFGITLWYNHRLKRN